MSTLPRHDWLGVRRFTSDLARPRTPVVHDHASIALYLEGGASFWMHGLYALVPGDLLLVPDATPHYLVEANGARAIGISLCLTCAPLPVRDHLLDLFETVRRGGCAARHLPPADADRMHQLMRDLETELQHRATGSALAVEACVSLLTVMLLRAEDGKRERQVSRVSPVVSRALEFVNRRGASGISLRDVAHHVSRSPAHVASLVKTTTGVTVVGWITRKRMSEGRQLLLETDESIEAIAERCGFASPSHFHRAFKRAHGMAPGEWRRVHRP